jgi:hypothetical protein
MRTTMLILLAALSVALVTAGNAIGGDLTTSPTIGAPIKREPVLMFDVTGSTLTGPIHFNYIVYNDGLVTGGTCGGFAGDNSAGTANATQADVAQLASDLIAAGGLKLPDQNLTVADVPLTTVTVFKGAEDARAHTFSYWLGVGSYAQINTVIADFRAKYPVSCFGVLQ